MAAHPFHVGSEELDDRDARGTRLENQASGNTQEEAQGMSIRARLLAALAGLIAALIVRYVQ